MVFASAALNKKWLEAACYSYSKQELLAQWAAWRGTKRGTRLFVPNEPYDVD